MLSHFVSSESSDDVGSLMQDVGVTAYAGAASLIQDESYLVAAARKFLRSSAFSG